MTCLEDIVVFIVVSISIVTVNATVLFISMLQSGDIIEGILIGILAIALLVTDATIVYTKLHKEVNNE